MSCLQQLSKRETAWQPRGEAMMTGQNRECSSRTATTWVGRRASVLQGNALPKVCMCTEPVKLSGCMRLFTSPGRSRL